MKATSSKIAKIAEKENASQKLRAIQKGGQLRTYQTSQPPNQPTNQPTSQPTSQPTKQQVNQPNKQTNGEPQADHNTIEQPLSPRVTCVLLL